MGADRSPTLVLDASVILKWVLDTETEPGHTAAQALLSVWKQGELDLLVPTLWVYEVGNILSIKKPLDARDSLQTLIRLGLTEVPCNGPLGVRTVELAHAYRLTFYDAAYLAVAELRSSILVTADGKLVRRLPPEAPIRLLEGCEPV